MALLRIRLTGSMEEADILVSALHGVDDVERVETVDDLMPHARDDSSSSNLSDDNQSIDIFCIEVATPTNAVAQRVQDIAELTARANGLVLEFVDRF